MYSKTMSIPVYMSGRRVELAMAVAWPILDLFIGETVMIKRCHYDQSTDPTRTVTLLYYASVYLYSLLICQFLQPADHPMPISFRLLARSEIEL